MDKITWGGGGAAETERVEGLKLEAGKVLRRGSQ